MYLSFVQKKNFSHFPEDLKRYTSKAETEISLRVLPY